MSAPARHYDVVVLGAGLGALVSAALLARRSWRVLVLGHGHKKPGYTYDGIRLARRAFTFLASASPAWGRVIVELAQSQTFRRRLASLDPMLQVLGPGLRLDLPPDVALFGREIDRELGAYRRVVDDLYTELAKTNAAVDAAFEKDVVWPPGGFWERRETAKVLSTLPFVAETGAPTDLFAELPREHVFRDVVSLPARFASDLAGEHMPTLALARLHGAWTRGVSALGGGEEELVEFLLERLRAHGGEARLADRAASIRVKGGKVHALVVDGDDAPLGVSFVVSDAPCANLLDLAADFSPPRDTKVPSVDVTEGRFVVSIVARTEGIPEPLAQESFLLPSRGGKAGKGPVVHLQRTRSSVPGTELLVAEAIMGAGEALDRTREHVLGVVLEHLPFLERHLVVCDSPHDGRPLWDFRHTTSQDRPVGLPSWGLVARRIERALLRGGGGVPEPEPMVPRYGVSPPWMHGLAGEALRAPLVNAFVTGRTALPALGQEGELLAAWSVARIITRTDRRKEKMLREMWSKVELS